MMTVDEASRLPQTIFPSFKLKKNVTINRNVTKDGKSFLGLHFV